MADLASPSNPYDSLPVTHRTRSAAEEAFLENVLTQTVSAGQAPGDGTENEPPITGRPPFPTRSSTNYIDAATSSPTLEKSSMSGDSAPSSAAAPLAPRPKAIKMPSKPSDDDLAAQNKAAEQAWLNEQAAAKRTSVDMRSEGMAGVAAGEGGGGGGAAERPGAPGRQQSWSAQDARRQMQEPLMKGVSEGAAHGYRGSS